MRVELLEEFFAGVERAQEEGEELRGAELAGGFDEVNLARTDLFVAGALVGGLGGFVGADEAAGHVEGAGGWGGGIVVVGG